MGTRIYAAVLLPRQYNFEQAPVDSVNGFLMSIFVWGLSADTILNRYVGASLVKMCGLCVQKYGLMTEIEIHSVHCTTEMVANLL